MGLPESPPGLSDGEVGIDPYAVRQLASALDGAVNAATAISRAIGRINERANQAMLTPLPPGAARSLAGIGPGIGSASSPPDGGALQSLTQQAPPVAAEIKVRLRHLRYYVSLPSTPGALFNGPALWFSDTPPPEPATDRSAISYITGQLGGTGDPRGKPGPLALMAICLRLSKLSASDVDAVLNGLSLGKLTQLNELLSGSDSNSGARNLFTSLILSNASELTIGRLRPRLTSLQLGGDSAIAPDPRWKTLKDLGQVKWQPVDEPLFGPDGPNPYTDISQKTVGDCYFLAALGAVARRYKHFIERHIRPDPNGNYTVTFYKNGQPVDVTVSPDLLTSSHGGILTADTVSGHDWVAIYEKAWAQLNGGYGAIDAGEPSFNAYEDAFTAITGQAASARTWGSQGGSSSSAPSLPDIQSLLRAGHLLTAGAYGPGTFTDSQGEKVVLDHGYWVNRVYTDPATHQQMIELVNPWGPAGSNQAPEYRHLTQAEFQEHFEELDDLPPLGTQPSGTT